MAANTSNDFRVTEWLFSHKALIVIVILASVLRLFRLNVNPPSLYWDEVSLGYNAFSILTHGIDEHGVSFPITHFLAYGDAKPPLYIYSIVPFMSVFGVNEWSVRLPSAIAGIIAVNITYLLSIFIQKELKLKNTWFPLLVTLLLAISPWHLQMSRVAYEANLALTFFLIGITSFLYAKKKAWLYLVSAIFFVATWYTFNAYRIFLPPFLIVLGLLYMKQLWHQKISVGLSIVLAIVLTAPLIPFVMSDQAHLRFEEVTIFKDLDPVLDSNERIALNQNALWSKIAYNRRIMYAAEFLDGFFDHFKADFLFFSGDVNPRLGVRDMGELYLVELPALLVGLFYLVKKKSRISLLLASWWLLGIIPAAVARETPHALRILQILPVPQIISGIGIVYLVKKIPLSRQLFFVGYLVCVGYYLNLYYLHYPKQWAESWQYGYKQLVQYLTQVEGEYDQIYVTNSLGRAHTNVLFYSKYDPIKFIEDRDMEIDQFGFVNVYGFGKYHFGDVTTEKPENEKWLLVDRPDIHLETDKILYTVYDISDQPVFILHEM